MSIVVGLWKLVGWLKGGKTPGLRLMAAGNLLVIALLVGVNVWQRLTINGLEDWRNNVLTSLSSAVDQRDKSGRLLSVREKDVQAHILALGRFRSDTIAASAKARADDATHSLRVVQADNSINQGAGNALQDRLDSIRADADALRRAAASGGLRRTESAPTGDSGGGGAEAVPALSAARSAADEAAGAHGFPATELYALSPMSIDERQLASEQAAQLDELISAIEHFATVRR